MTLDRLRGEMSQAVQLPGVSTIWTWIINRIDMTTGIRSEVGVRSLAGTCVCSRIWPQGRGCGSPRAWGEQCMPRAGDGRVLNIRIDRCSGRYGIGVGDIRKSSNRSGRTTLDDDRGRERFRCGCGMRQSTRRSAGAAMSSWPGERSAGAARPDRAFSTRAVRDDRRKPGSCGSSFC